MRNQFRPLLLGLLSFLCLSSVWAADLKSYKEVYQKNSGEILQTFQPKFADLQQQYQKSLDALKALAKNQGDLKKTMAAIAEIDRFQKAKSQPAAPDESAIPEIKALQSAYVRRYTELETDLAAKLGTLTVKYEQALDRLQKELVKAGKLDEATAVQQERDKAQTALTGYADQLAKQKGSAATNGTGVPERGLASKPMANHSSVQRPTLPTGCDKGILVHYTFDSVDGKTVMDSGPRQCHGTAVQVEHVKEGKLGGALLFSGKGAHVVIPTPKEVELGKNDFTIATWLKTTTNGGLLAKGGFDRWERQEKQFYIWDGKPAYVGNACGFIKGSAVVTDGNWHHVAVTYGWEQGRRAGRQEIYVDGKCVTSLQNFTGKPDPPDATELRIGWGHAGDCRRTDFAGLLDEFMIFNRCLSGPQVQKLYETLGGK